ncbi:radical SAM/SPASM domain-containing protein [Rikenella microfusus]|uniref:radical SAM/SPASM domain-containing protein n=1 Tax=Rikenella microfusus TaxID=28139 RepID=UPI00248D78F5|nr:SPASM domain-containing protein [Rikenella microfusus]
MIANNTFRPSTYNIIIHLEKDPSQYMLIHGYTGAIDIANANVVRLLKPGGRVTKENPFVSKQTFEALVARGYLTQQTAAQERTYCQRWANLLHAHKKLFGTRSYMFMVSYDCNFRCPYCYESDISQMGKHWTKQAFTKEMVDKAYQAMTEIMPDEKRRGRSITLYGGEPLLAKNREIVEYIVQQGIALGYTFEAISNGYEIEHYKDLLGPGKIQSVQISMDGPKEIHDKRRYHYLNGGTFDKIFANIGMALEAGAQIALRANTDATNYRHIESLYDQFKEAGYVDNKLFHFSAALVVGDENIRPESPHAVTTEISSPSVLLTKPDFIAKLQQTTVPGQHQEMWMFRKLYNAIKHNTRINFDPVYCGVQVGAYIFDPYGDIYNCWETVGKECHIIGHYSNGVTWEEEIKKWHQRNVATAPRCSGCKYAFLCGGGCLAKVLRAYGDLYKSYCHYFPESFEGVANRVYQAYLHDKEFGNVCNCQKD